MAERPLIQERNLQFSQNKTDITIAESLQYFEALCTTEQGLVLLCNPLALMARFNHLFPQCSPATLTVSAVNAQSVSR